MKIVAIWTMDSSHVDYADQMTRSDLLNIAQSGVVAKTTDVYSGDAYFVSRP